MERQIKILGKSFNPESKDLCTLYGTFSNPKSEFPKYKKDIHKYSTHKELCDFFKIRIICLGL